MLMTSSTSKSKCDLLIAIFLLAVVYQSFACFDACGQVVSVDPQQFNLASRSAIVGQTEPAVIPPQGQGIAPAGRAQASIQGVPVPIDRGNLTAPVRSLANVVLGGQAISTRTVLGSTLVRIRSQDEIWLVSGRRDDGCLTCEWMIDSHWEQIAITKLTTAHDSDVGKSTVVYVHGNQTNDEYARARGLQLYQELFSRRDCDCQPAPPVRFVIFAWRSEREKARSSSDFKIKLARSIRVGSKFRCFLDRFDSRNMLLVGFSLGGQVILSGLREQQLSVEEESQKRKSGKYSVALITPALDPVIESTCLDAVDGNVSVSQTVAFIARNDPAIRASKILTQSRRSHVCDQRGDEITFERLGKWCPGQQFGKVRVEDITAEVRSCHSVTKYAEQSTTIRNDITQLLELNKPSAASAGPTSFVAPLPAAILLPTSIE
jgi:hypothetical protein